MPRWEGTDGLSEPQEPHEDVAYLRELAAMAEHPGCEVVHQQDYPLLHFTGRTYACDYSSPLLDNPERTQSAVTLGPTLHCFAEVTRNAADGSTGELGQKEDALHITNGTFCVSDLINKGGLTGGQRTYREDLTIEEEYGATGLPPLIELPPDDPRI
jgi:hypothetical protein